MLGVALARIIPVARLRFGRDDRRRHRLLIILVKDVPEDLFPIAVVLFGLIEQRLEASKGFFQLADQVENTTDEGWLVQSKNLHKPLHEGFDSSDIQVVLECLEQEVEVERLLRGGGDTRVQKRLVECPVEAVVGNLVRRGDLLNEKEGLNARVEV